MNDIRQVELDGNIFRVRAATANDRPPRLLVLIHGWTGDEKVMWVFTHHLPQNYWILAPRGFYPVTAETPSGFGWTPEHQGVAAPVQTYFPAAEKLSQFLLEWMDSADVHFERYSLMGFSQGAALAYTLALTQPGMIDAVAALAGFVPTGTETYVQNRPLSGRPVFIAHGTRDDTVPIEKALEAAQIMRTAGAEVTYCESEVGHKLGANCLHGLDTFFS